jgi:hypothetical protein
MGFSLQWGSGLILLKVGTNISISYILIFLILNLMAGKFGAVRELILLTVGTNISTDYMLILLMAVELAQLVGSSFSR